MNRAVLPVGTAAWSSWSTSCGNVREIKTHAPVIDSDSPSASATARLCTDSVSTVRTDLSASGQSTDIDAYTPSATTSTVGHCGASVSQNGTVQLDRLCDDTYQTSAITAQGTIERSRTAAANVIWVGKISIYRIRYMKLPGSAYASVASATLTIASRLESQRHAATELTT